MVSLVVVRTSSPVSHLLGRASVVFALQTWLAETPEQRRTTSTPGYFSVGMGCMHIVSLESMES